MLRRERCIFFSFFFLRKNWLRSSTGGTNIEIVSDTMTSCASDWSQWSSIRGYAYHNLNPSTSSANRAESGVERIYYWEFFDLIDFTVCTRAPPLHATSISRTTGRGYSESVFTVRVRNLFATRTADFCYQCIYIRPGDSRNVDEGLWQPEIARRNRLTNSLSEVRYRDRLSVNGPGHTTRPGPWSHFCDYYLSTC